LIRFLADADLNAKIVSGCLHREPAMDFLAANKARLARVPDPEVLAMAAAQDRIVVTHDRHTMPRHFGQFMLDRGSSPGVFVVGQDVPIAEVIEELLLVWSASDAEEWRDRIVDIPF
jgi:predicted nuclease of predicted toxin-antitoxin system